MIKVKEPSAFAIEAKYYLLANLLMFIFFLSVAFSLSGSSNFFKIFLAIAVILGLPFYIYIILLYRSWSFLVDENSITINSGIIVKKSKIIPFDKVQNISQKQGIIMGMFGITNFDIWTSSPSQININKGQTSNKPDGNLVLTTEDAEWLQRFMTSKPGDGNKASE
jgi:membrane protein YdbS with pleckstrin-like domain